MSVEHTSHFEEHLFVSGHTACSGCGQSMGARLVADVAGKNTIITNATGCLEVFSSKTPESSWRLPWIHSLFENSAALASGVEAALRYLGKIDKIRVIAQAGDGGTADIGLQALSGMLERGHDVLFVCLPPETELILGDGTIIEIGEFVDNIVISYQEEAKKLLTNCAEIVQMASFSIYHSLDASSNLIVPVEEEIKEKVAEIAPVRDITILSWDKAKFLPMNIVCVQRKLSGDNLVRITTASGRTLSLTPEHPVLVDTLDGPKWQRADLLKIKDEVYAPRKIELNAKKEFYIVDFLDGNIKVKLPGEVKTKIIQELKKRYGTVKEAAKIIGFKYWQLKEKSRMIDLQGLRKISKEVSALKWEEIREELTEFAIQGGKPIILKEKRLSSDMLYILGLISSDGYLKNKDYIVGFTNKEKILIKEFKKRYRRLFCGRKISEFKDTQNIMYLMIANPILSLLGKRLQIKSDPKELIRLSEELISSFLQGFFDGDGYCGITKTKHSYDAKVILSTVEERLAKRLRQMLQRIGIACLQDSRLDRFDLIISSREDIENFLYKVSSKHPLQRKRMEEIKKLWKTRKQRGSFFSIAPKICGPILKQICEKERISITKLDKKRNIYSLAKGTRRATKERFLRYKEDLIKILGKEKDSLFKELDSYLKNEFYLDPIIRIEVIPCTSKFVYDLTVENSHLFIPEGAFVVSNCYDNEAYMNTGVQRSGLTPLYAATTTSPVGKDWRGNWRFKKPMLEICASHFIPYAASASVGFPQDLQRKVKKALDIRGPKYIQIHVPCPLGWGYESALTLDIAKAAVNCGLYPLVEYAYGKLTNVFKIPPKPIIDYIKSQTRFRHILTAPQALSFLEEVAKKNIEYYGLVTKKEGP